MDDTVLQILGGGDRNIATGLDHRIAAATGTDGTATVFGDFNVAEQFVLRQLARHFKQVVRVILG